MNIAHRNNVHLIGNPAKATVIYAHGFGCNQHMWSAITPAFTDSAYQILFDFVGSGQSDITDYNFRRYASLEGYAQDILEICDALNLHQDVIFIGHSVACSIGTLAANARPGLFQKMIFLGPSPCFLNIPPDYQGGFERSDLEGLIELMDQNYLGWASYLAPVVAGRDDTVSGKLSDSFCSTDPVIAKHFAQATFFADNRQDFEKLQVPSLILQHQEDVLAPLAVGDFVHRSIKHSQLQILEVTGHAAHMSHPQLVIDAVKQFLAVELAC